jgi:hypothetical protein
VKSKSIIKIVSSLENLSARATLCVVIVFLSLAATAAAASWQINL